MNDRTIGYISIFLIVLITGIVTVTFLSNSKTPTEIRTVEFPTVAGLSLINPDDPVTLKGMVIGKVLSTELKNEKVLVHIISNNHIDIYGGYYISVGAQGIMGNRFLNIEPGNDIKKSIPVKTHLTGMLLPSPPEAVAEMKWLIEAIRELNRFSEKLLYGDSTHESFVAAFQKTVSATDSFSNEFSKKTILASTQITSILDTLSSIVSMCADFKNSLYQKMPPALDSLELILSSSYRGLKQIDSILLQTERIVQLNHKQDLSKIDQSINEFQNNLSTLRVRLKELQQNGLFLRVRLK
ncbi:MAG TPA: MlaD family protein [Chitinispirillaceae bacterium]|nr:MlaD family protein [Chitinispirillaceae bacterium]